MTANGKTAGRIERAARLRWVQLAQMRVNPLAQRDLNQARVSKLAAAFDPELMDAPTVNHRGGWYYLIDGQHRIAALKEWLSSWQDQQVQCWTYEGLREAEEAEKFLALNDTLPVRACRSRTHRTSSGTRFCAAEQACSTTAPVRGRFRIFYGTTGST